MNLDARDDETRSGIIATHWLEITDAKTKADLFVGLINAREQRVMSDVLSALQAGTNVNMRLLRKQAMLWV